MLPGIGDILRCAVQGQKWDQRSLWIPPNPGNSMIPGVLHHKQERCKEKLIQDFNTKQVNQLKTVIRKLFFFFFPQISSFLRRQGKVSDIIGLVRAS